MTYKHLTLSKSLMPAIPTSLKALVLNQNVTEGKVLIHENIRFRTLQERNSQDNFESAYSL